MASEAGTTEHAFQADVAKVLDIVIHSLYSHPEIFLRELISNAADALDRLRVRALTEHGLREEGEELAIRVLPDRAAQTIVIADNGVGMTREELIESLGTIAHSGSRKFLELLKQRGPGAESVDLIGQFGVGFYSSFLVANRVEVTSRAAGTEQAFRWSSEARGSFQVEPVDESVPRGTSVKLFLQDEHKDFVEEYRLRELVRRYSDFVPHPIRLEVVDEKDAKKTPRVETLNQGTALWKRPKEEITAEQYDDFYRHVSHDPEAPRARIHFTAEGTRLFTGLLYVPRNPPFDLFFPGQRRGVRLYVKRVFIMDDCESLIPEWLRFVRGVVDSDDLPLNVSRELLQEDRTVRTMRKVLVRKSLEMLEELAQERPEDYAAFWKDFGAVLKEGLHYEPEHRERLAALLRYASSREELTSLEEYVKRMPEGQPALYYVMAPDRKTAEGSPHSEALRKKGYEVLYMTDPVDEWAVHGLPAFQEKPLVSAMKTDLELDGDKKDEHTVDTDLESLKDRMLRVLGEEVSEVRVSHRLTDSPSCLVTPEGGMHAHIERLLRARQKGLPVTKRIFEINPDHPVIRKIKTLHLDPAFAPRTDDWIRLLYDQALLAEGSPLADPTAFSRRLAEVMTQALGGAEHDEAARESAEQDAGSARKKKGRGRAKEEEKE